MNKRLHWIAQLVVALGGALSLKFYYSTASVNQLRWILTPTTRLVELVTGRTFAFESHAGYMSSDHTFLIAASCAGVNFLITAFVMLSVGRLWHDRRLLRNTGAFNCVQSGIARSWIFLPAAAGIAYLATILANTLRISLALQMQKTPISFSLWNANQMHRLEGVIVYFGCLLLLLLLTERLRCAGDPTRNASRSSMLFLRRCLLPLTIYYAITLGLPFANGAWRQGMVFVEHSGVVIVTPLVLILFVVACRLAESVVSHPIVLIKAKRPQGYALKLLLKNKC